MLSKEKEDKWIQLNCGVTFIAKVLQMGVKQVQIKQTKNCMSTEHNVHSFYEKHYRKKDFPSDFCSAVGQELLQNSVYYLLIVDFYFKTLQQCVAMTTAPVSKMTFKPDKYKKQVFDQLVC